MDNSRRASNEDVKQAMEALFGAANNENFDKTLNRVIRDLGTLRYRENPEFVVARTINDKLAVSVHADDNFMFTLVVALAEKICKDSDTHPARFCVTLMETLRDSMENMD